MLFDGNQIEGGKHLYNTAGSQLQQNTEAVALSTALLAIDSHPLSFSD